MPRSRPNWPKSTRSMESRSSIDALSNSWPDTTTPRPCKPRGSSANRSWFPSQSDLGEGDCGGRIQGRSGVDNVRVQVLDKAGNVLRTDDLGLARPETTLRLGRQEYRRRYRGRRELHLQGERNPRRQVCRCHCPAVGDRQCGVRSGGGFVLDLGNLGDFAFNDVQEIY